MKLIIAIRSLEVGGAERIVLDIAKNMPDALLVTLYGGAFEQEAKDALQDRLIILNDTKPKMLLQWLEIIKTNRPKAVYAHLGEMQLLSLFAKFYGAKAVWCLHSTSLNWSSIGSVGKFLFALLGKLSKYADACVGVCQSAIDYHEQNGYNFKAKKVIYAGVDLQKFTPKNRAQDGFFNIGISARLDPIKGYDALAKAANIVLEQLPNAKFFSAGSDNEKIRQECTEILGKNSENFIWLGRQSNMQEFYNSIDLMVSASYAEAFSIAILEAMACNKKIVATNVGDSALIIGKCGLLVPPNNPQALADAILASAKEDFESSRTRIYEMFSLEKCAQETYAYLQHINP